MAVSSDEILEHLGFFEDWTERYRYIIDLGKKLEPYPEELRDDAHKVRGCMSQVWLTHTLDDGHLRFRGDSDAAIVRGLIAVLLAAFDRKTPAEVLEFDLDTYFAELGLESHLSPNRRNGFFSMVERIRGVARELS